VIDGRLFWLISRLLYDGVFLSIISIASEIGSAEKDPHRHVCETASCQAIKRFLESHYCGESPFGNGPADGCDIRVARKQKINAKLVADFNCTWSDEKKTQVCKLVGQIPVALMKPLDSELRRLGLPISISNDVKYRLLSSTRFSVVEAYYESAKGPNLWLCQVIAVFSDPSKIAIAHEVKYQKTDLDVPLVTTWTPVDIADVNGDGEPEVVLQGDAYEDHWFEVLTVKPDLSTTLLYSGLGYYL
jgi:hypothetical protein